MWAWDVGVGKVSVEILDLFKFHTAYGADDFLVELERVVDACPVGVALPRHGANSMCWRVELRFLKIELQNTQELESVMSARMDETPWARSRWVTS